MSKYTEEFLSFWKVYPRRIAKRAAFTAFEKALEWADAEEIIEGAKQYAKYIQRENIEAQFVCHATTWLNQGRYEDEHELNIEKQEVISPEESRRRAREAYFKSKGIQDPDNVVRVVR